MRTFDAVSKDFEYLRDPEGGPLGANLPAFMAEMLFDIREILLFMAQKQGVNIDSFFPPESGEEDLQPADDDASVPEVGGPGSEQDPPGDRVEVGSDSWFTDRASQLRDGLHDQPDA